MNGERGMRGGALGWSVGCVCVGSLGYLRGGAGLPVSFAFAVCIALLLVGNCESESFCFSLD